ncbi:MAG: MOSC domain-containing protein [Chthonomonadales bacterium]|nr:MOSC domain-containing protein [Chthonomonadales bacterium]
MVRGSVAAVCLSEGSGFPRPKVAEGVLREDLGFVGNLHSVSGPREVCLFDAALYEALRAQGVDVGPGSVGENLTLTGITLADLGPGDRIRLGDQAVVEITVPRKACSRLAKVDERLPSALEGRAGWLARVVVGGTVRPGDEAELLARAE